MNSLEANIRNNSSKGQLNAIRNNGNVPAIIYGGKDQNQKVSISKKLLKVLIDKENFLSNIITLKVDGKPQNVLPREVKYHILSDEPTHVDFLRVLPGVNIKIVSKNYIKEKTDCVIVFAWNYFNEIKKNNKDIAKKFISIKHLEK